MNSSKTATTDYPLEFEVGVINPMMAVFSNESVDGTPISVVGYLDLPTPRLICSAARDPGICEA